MTLTTEDNLRIELATARLLVQYWREKAAAERAKREVMEKVAWWSRWQILMCQGKTVTIHTDS